MSKARPNDGGRAVRRNRKRSGYGEDRIVRNLLAITVMAAIAFALGSVISPSFGLVAAGMAVLSGMLRMI